MSAIRVELPQHLRTLAGAGQEITLHPNEQRPLVGGPGEVTVEVPGVVSISSVLDALEAKYPMLQGTIRDHGTQQRRAFLRFFVCEEDWSHDSMEKALPDAVANGREPLLIIGAIAGGC